MMNFKFYKQTCLALAMAAACTLTGCSKNDTKIVSNESIVDVKGYNNNVVVNNGSFSDKNSSIMVNGVTLKQENDEIKLEVNGQNISVNGSNEEIDNVEIEIKSNEEGDGSLVFVKNIYEYILKDGFVQYGLILDIPEDQKLRNTKIYSYTYQTMDEFNHVYTIYEVDEDGNEILLETHYINSEKDHMLTK